jgi:hypothetical protein
MVKDGGQWIRSYYFVQPMKLRQKINKLKHFLSFFPILIPSHSPIYSLILFYFSFFFVYVFRFCSFVSKGINGSMFVCLLFDDGDRDHYINRQGTFLGLLGSLWLILRIEWFFACFNILFLSFIIFFASFYLIAFMSSTHFFLQFFLLDGSLLLK